MAPEVTNAKPHGLVVDFWALGVIIYELMNGKRPYNGIHRKEYKDNLASNEVQIKKGEQPKGWSNDSADIVNKLLTRKEDKRLGAKGIKKKKKHNWLKTEYFFDESYLESFCISTKLKEDITLQAQNLRNPNVQKLFRNFYFDKDKEEELRNKINTASTAINGSSKKGYI